MTKSTVTVTRNNGSHALRAAVVVALAGGAAMALVAPALAEPTNPDIRAGAATITGTGTGSLTVTTASPRLAIEWDTFSIAAGNSVTFAQPSSTSIVLNRVVTAATSTITGDIVANGQVWLINPNGIVFNGNGTINTAGFMAAAMDVANTGVMNGFDNPGGDSIVLSGSNSASVSSLGTNALRGGPGGYVALAAARIDNGATIGATSGVLGLVELSSGRQLTVSPNGGLINYTLSLTNPNRVELAGDAVTNTGSITAATVNVRAHADSAFDAGGGTPVLVNAINMGGSVLARTAADAGGTIRLLGTGGVPGGATDAGQITVSGTLTGPKQAEKLVGINGHALELPIEKHHVVMLYTDRPGIVAVYGQKFGEAGVNIAGMQISRLGAGDQALSVVTLDSPISDELLDEVSSAIDADLFRQIEITEV